MSASDENTNETKSIVADIPRLSFEELFETHYRGLYRTAYRIVRTHQEAEDIVQEAFIKLHQKQHEVDRANCKPWLYRVCINLGINALESRKVRTNWAQQKQDSEPARSLLGGIDLSMDVRETMKQLPTRQVQLLLLYSAGLRHAEMAEVLGVSTSSMSQLLLRAKQAFLHIYQSPSTHSEGQ